MNLYHWDNYELIGLDNFQRALLKVDSGFLKALLTTVLWTIFNMVIQVVLAFFIALGLNVREMKLARVYKTLLMFHGQCRHMFLYFYGVWGCLTQSSDS